MATIIPISSHPRWRSVASPVRVREEVKTALLLSPPKVEPKRRTVNEAVVLELDLEFYNDHRRSKNQLNQVWRRSRDLSEAARLKYNITIFNEHVQVMIELIYNSPLELIYDQLLNGDLLKLRNQTHFFVAVAYVYDKRMERILLQVHPC